MLFITLKKEQNNFSKCFAFASSAFCTYIFSTCNFCWLGTQEYFLPQGAGDPIATPLQRWALNLGL